MYKLEKLISLNKYYFIAKQQAENNKSSNFYCMAFQLEYIKFVYKVFFFSNIKYIILKINKGFTNVLAMPQFTLFVSFRIEKARSSIVSRENVRLINSVR